MAGLDQDRHPMRFAVAASTASGLLVAALTAAAGRAFRWWPDWHPLLPLLVLGGGLAVLPLWLRAPALRGRAPRRVFLVVAAFTHKNWVALLIRDLHENLERRGYDLVLKVPDRDYSGASQVRLLDAVLRRRGEYAGGFIMVNEGDAIRPDLARFCAGAGMPLVFVDAEPFEARDSYPPRTAYTGCDDAQIGDTAARWVARYLRGKKARRPLVLAVNGGRYAQREQVFAKRLQAELPDAQVAGACAGFSRPQAAQVVTARLRQLDADGRRLHAIFCTNDEMALGAADALVFSQVPWAAEVAVAGVDGTPDARALIEGSPGPLRATVVQDSYKVAETAVTLLERMLRGEHVPERTSVPAEILARD